MSNETKIGLLAVVSIAALIWGYKFLKGQNILSTSNFIYAEYANVDQLQNSSPILINGFQVGVVSTIYLKPEDMNTIVVEMDIDRGINVPKSAIAEIISTSVMGSKAVRLTFDRPCQGDGCAANGDYIKGITRSMISSMMGDPEDMKAYVDVLKDGVDGLVDSLSAKAGEDGEIGQSIDDFKTTLANLRSTTARLDRLMATSGGQMTGILTNLEDVSGNIKSSNADIKNMIGNLSTFSGNLKEVDLGKTLEKANSTLDGASTAMGDVKTTLESTNNALAELKTMVAKINDGKGTLGKLSNDEAFAKNLDETIRNVNLLTQDLRLNPQRYTRVLAKKRKPYTVPEVDPADQK